MAPDKRLRACVVCGKEFLPRSSEHLVCSWRCSRVRAKGGKAAQRKGTRGRPRASAPKDPVRCPSCGSKVGSDGRRIDKSRTIRKGLPMRKCPGCHKPFWPRSGRQIWCSKKCACRSMEPEERRARIQAAFEPRCFDCECCGRHVMVDDPYDARATTCSKACTERLRKERNGKEGQQ